MAAAPVIPDADLEEDDAEDQRFPGGEYLTFMQVVKRYGISRQSLHTLCVNREVPYYTSYNGRRRFRKEEMDAYLGLRKVAAKVPPRSRPTPKTLATAG